MTAVDLSTSLQGLVTDIRAGKLTLDAGIDKVQDIVKIPDMSAVGNIVSIKNDMMSGIIDTFKYSPLAQVGKDGLNKLLDAFSAAVSNVKVVSGISGAVLTAIPIASAVFGAIMAEAQAEIKFIMDQRMDRYDQVMAARRNVVNNLIQGEFTHGWFRDNFKFLDFRVSRFQRKHWLGPSTFPISEVSPFKREERPYVGDWREAGGKPTAPDILRLNSSRPSGFMTYFSFFTAPFVDGQSCMMYAGSYDDPKKPDWPGFLHKFSVQPNDMIYTYQLALVSNLYSVLRAAGIIEYQLRKICPARAYLEWYTVKDQFGLTVPAKKLDPVQVLQEQLLACVPTIAAGIRIGAISRTDVKKLAPSIQMLVKISLGEHTMKQKRRRRRKILLKQKQNIDRKVTVRNRQGDVVIAKIADITIGVDHR